MNAHPRHYTQAEGIFGRNKVEIGNMNWLDMGRHTKWRNNKANEINDSICHRTMQGH